MRGHNDLLLYQNDRTHEWRWRLTSGTNGKVIGASSESFKRLRKCIENFRLVSSSGETNFAASVRYRIGAKRISTLKVFELLGPKSLRSVRLVEVGASRSVTKGCLSSSKTPTVDGELSRQPTLRN